MPQSIHQCLRKKLVPPKKQEIACVAEHFLHSVEFPSDKLLIVNEWLEQEEP